MRSHASSSSSSIINPERNESYGHDFFVPSQKNCQFHRIEELFHLLPMPLNAIPSFPVFQKHPNPTVKQKPTYAMIVSYKGNYFNGGYEYNVNHNPPQATVQETLSQRLMEGIQRMDATTTTTTNNDPQKHTTTTRQQDDPFQKKKKKKNANQEFHLKIACAGRTDSYVHAKANCISFTLPYPKKNRIQLTNAKELSILKNQINELTPSNNNTSANTLTMIPPLNTKNQDITIHTIQQVDTSFHATFRTTSREYIYVLPLPAEQSSSSSLTDYYIQITNIIQTLLSEMIHQPIDYYGLSYGKIKTKDSICTLTKASCWLYYYNNDTTTNNNNNYNNNNNHPTRNIPNNNTVQILYQPPSTSTTKNTNAITTTTALNDNDGEVVDGFRSCWKTYYETYLLNTNDTSSGSTSNHASTNVSFPYCMVFKIESNRFLRRMIRKLINSVLQEACKIYESHYLDTESYPSNTSLATANSAASTVPMEEWKHNFKNKIESKDRSDNKPAPPHGLCLWKVTIDE